jgi:hypothetical protein
MKLSTLRPIVQSKDLFFPFGGNVFNSLFSDSPEAADENMY